MRATTPTRVLSPIFALMALVVVTLGVPRMLWRKPRRCRWKGSPSR